MNDHRNLPALDSLSIVTAMVLLSYSITAFVRLPERSLELQLPGFLFVIRLNIFTIVSIVVALLAAAGSEWIISDHPSLEGQRHWYHWIIPALTAMVIGVPLNAIQVSPAWWVIFGMGGFLLLAVLTAEYISVDPVDHYYQLASITLTVVFMSLFLILAIVVRGAELRLYAVLSALVPAVALLAARVIHLRLFGKWRLAWAGGISLIMGQLTAALFYLPVKPIQFGLILLAVLYGLTVLAGNIEEGDLRHRAWAEPVIMFTVFLIISFIL
jgi:hypothetical protein